MFAVIPLAPVDEFDDAFALFRQRSDQISVDSPYYPTHYFQSVLPVVSFFFLFRQSIQLNFLALSLA